MSKAVLVGRDSISILLKDLTNDLADENAVEISPIGNVGHEIIGKNKNSIIYSTEDGRHCKINIRVLRGSEADSWLGMYYSYFTILHIFTPIYGSLERRIGDGDGSVHTEFYNMTGLFYVDEPLNCEITTNGGVRQAVVEYHLQGLVERG